MRSLHHHLKYISFLAIVAIPLEKKGWTEISYGKLPANIVTHSAKTLNIQVKSSASPLVYKLDQPLNIKSFIVNLKFKGDISTPATDGQIEEDSIFRLGLVVEGDKTLSGVKKLFAPDWVKQLFALASANTGLDKIYFFNVGRATSQMGKSRLHPKSELMKEEIVVVRAPNENSVTVAKELSKPLKTAAIWISVDGDDTKSSFETTIENITINTPD